MKRAHRTSLPLDFAVLTTVLTLAACLFPFEGWRLRGLGPFDFLAASWPRYYTGLDLVLNVLGFIPLAFAWSAAFCRRVKPGRLVLLVWLGASVLSLGIEIAQTFLPSRVASNLDLGCNSLGALIGALLGLRGGGLVEAQGPLERWRDRRLLAGRQGSLGLVLIALWWFSLLNPSSYLFANGDLHAVLRQSTVMVFSGQAFQVLEAALAAANTLALGLFAQRVLRPPAVMLVALTLLLGVAAKSFADWVFLNPAQPWHWATPGALHGLLIGLIALALSWRLPALVRHVLASTALLAATGLVNLAPNNPYWDAVTQLNRGGHVQSFHGATELAAALWPFVALVWLGVVGPARRREGWR